jgi:xanthine dehydrogenase large subunit
MEADRILGGAGDAVRHDSAHLHVSGEAVYVDDILEARGTLHAAFGLSARAHARIQSMDLSKVGTAPGVIAVMTAADIPGENNFGHMPADDPILADNEVNYQGQPIFAVAARTVDQARRAARLAAIEYEDLPAILCIDDALAAQSFVRPNVRLERGDPKAALATALHRLQGRLALGGQEQFYLEGQVSYAIPREDGQMLVHSSTQDPGDVQHKVAHALGCDIHTVAVECRRMGGGFGGKETQPALFACAAALLARRTGRPVKFRADRDDDIIGTGKRHDFLYHYDAGFDRQGRIEALDLMLASRCGLSADLSAAVNDRAVFHCDNAYFLQNVRIVSHRCKTNTVSSTAFRGFGGPQGMFAVEAVIAAIARHLGIDALDVRTRNLYGKAPRDVTHYGMTLKDNVLPELFAELETRSEYRKRREAVKAFNASSALFKRGLAFTPVKFGIAFTSQSMNQAGALVHLYADGSVHLNHGGAEMGQGLMIKVAQIVAAELQVDLARVHITATSTGKVPNTSPTAASSGTDLNGEAARDACRTLRQRLSQYCADTYHLRPEEIVFSPNQVAIGLIKTLSFTQLVREAFLARVSLSATGYWRTPEIQFDRERWRGTPFYYFAYGAAVSEVVIDVLTGESRLLCADILHDAGRSLNPAIDRGQIEGGFIQGMGWLTMEEVVWDDQGRLLTHAPSTYKIPVASDCPPVFNVWLWEKGENVRDIAHRSKAVGEPPLMLALSVFHAIYDAIGATSHSRDPVPLEAPATPENILKAIHELHRNPGR